MTPLIYFGNYVQANMYTLLLVTVFRSLQRQQNQGIFTLSSQTQFKICYFNINVSQKMKFAAAVATTFSNAFQGILDKKACMPVIPLGLQPGWLYNSHNCSHTGLSHTLHTHFSFYFKFSKLLSQRTIWTICILPIPAMMPTLH